MNRLTIDIGQKCYAKTNLSRVDLLCTITAINVNKVTVKLPCTLKGYTHIEVPLKDIVLKQASKQEIKQPPKPAPKDNPYRRHLEYLLANPQAPKPLKIVETPATIEDKSEPSENDMLAIYLRSLPIEQRRRDIENLGKDGKKYHYLLK